MTCSPESLRRRCRLILASALSALLYAEVDHRLQLPKGTMAGRIGPNATRWPTHRDVIRCLIAAGQPVTFEAVYPDGPLEMLAAVLEDDKGMIGSNFGIEDYRGAIEIEARACGVADEAMAATGARLAVLPSVVNAARVWGLSGLRTAVRWELR